MKKAHVATILATFVMMAFLTLHATAQRPVAQGCGIPTVTAVNPPSGPLAGGTSVTITGSNFFAGSTTVTFGGIPATGVVVSSFSSLTAVTPAGVAPGAVDVAVTSTGCGTGTLPGGFTYVAGASVPALSPLALAALALVLGAAAVVALKR